ncbi:MAG: DUF4230 domain-containing protein [Synechocystis sp.]|nr:DUF4230 domain-containing protein [Synechocystis sp.]
MKNQNTVLAKPQPFFKSLLILGGSSIALTLAIAAIHLGQATWQTLRHWGQWTRITHEAPQTDWATVVVQQIRGVSELTTTIFAMETVVPTSQARQWGNVVLGRTELLYIGYGEVRAGINLRDITTAAVQQTGDRLTVTLPPPQILDKKIDVGRSRIYDYDRGFLNLGPDTAPQLQAFAQRETLKKIVAAACDQGILAQANNQAETALKGLLDATGSLDIVIKTTSPSHCQG